LIIELIDSRTDDLSEPTDIYLKVAEFLKHQREDIYVSRAQFITEQCLDEPGEEIFSRYRELWGIPQFDENIVSINDFRRGFLFTFREHTTEWSDNQIAKEWFLTSFEARFIRRYELWTWQSGFDECLEIRKGSYKEILQSLIKDGDYSVLSSPAITNEELNAFVKNFQQVEGDYSLEEIIADYISSNPNYK